MSGIGLEDTIQQLELSRFEKRESDSLSGDQCMACTVYDIHCM